MNRTACSPTAAPLELRGTTHTFSVAARNRKASHYLGNDEPSLDELLGDEVIRRVMARDGVQPDHVRALASFIRE